MRHGGHALWGRGARPMFLLEDESHYVSAGNNPATVKTFSMASMPSEARNEFWATLALRHCPGLGARSAARLLKFYGSALEAFDNSGNWRSMGIPQTCAKSLRDGAWRKDAKKEWESAKKLDAPILLWNSCDYPARLRQLPDAPALLYCRGNLDLLAAPCVAIVGSRNASSASMEIAASLSRSLSGWGITIVSGMAMGIDSKAHWAALGEVGKSLGVLGTGLDICYPSSNRELYRRMCQEGLLLSEFAAGVAPSAWNFPVRNRIISGLALGVAVIEAEERSGSLITARLALEQNREVFAVPGIPLSNRSAGCKNLIRQGAHPVFEAQDIIRELADALKPYGALHFPARAENSTQVDINIRNNGREAIAEEFEDNKAACEFPDVDAREITEKMVENDLKKGILNILQANGAMLSDELSLRLQVSSAELNAVLVCMEMLGQVKKLPGARYEAC